MYDYTKVPKDKYYPIEYVDYDIELLGLTIDKIAYTVLIFFTLLFLLGPLAALPLTSLYAFLMNRMYRMELAGKPITFNPNIQKYLRKFPKLFSELIYIELAEKKYRT